MQWAPGHGQHISTRFGLGTRYAQHCLCATVSVDRSTILRHYCDAHGYARQGAISIMNNRFLTIAGIILVALLSNGCAMFTPDRIHYTWQEPTAHARTNMATQSAPITINDGKVIGIALSGGGSRASVFGAAGLEVLAEAGVVERATYISSVSGGGFPAVYYALNKPTPCDLATKAAPCTSESFATFKAAMRHNFFSDMTLRQFAKPGRITSPTRRLSSLQEALDHQIIKHAAFADLPASPVLLINGARYDDGRRFVFSNVAIPEEESDIAQFSNQTLRTASFSQPGCARPTPPEFPVALAIAISAGFPPLLGPASLEMPESCDGGDTQYWHLGDGGILDNTGVETIEDYALRALTNGPRAKQIIIFSLDAGRSTSSQTMMGTRNLKLWTSDPGRVVEIVGMRAKAYRDVALQSTRAHDGVSITTIKMRYTDARIDQWPASCGNRTNDPQSISDHLAAIPTNLKISDCDADLMELAARDVVTRALRENAALLTEISQK